VVRGGNYFNNARNCRVSYRNHNAPDNRNDNIGFRLALSPSSRDSRMAATEQGIVLLPGCLGIGTKRRLFKAQGAAG